MKKLRIGCVLMAADDPARFDSNRLAVEFRGRSLIRRALDAVPEREVSRVAVVSAQPYVLELAKRYGFGPVLNSSPELGEGRTLHLGLNAMAGMGAVMIMAADQPCLTKSSVKAHIEFFLRQPDCIAAMAYGRRRGNPAIFPGEYLEELLQLEGKDQWGTVLMRHEERLRLYQVEDEAELLDAEGAMALEEQRRPEQHHG